MVCVWKRTVIVLEHGERDSVGEKQILDGMGIWRQIGICFDLWVVRLEKSTIMTSVGEKDIGWDGYMKTDRDLFRFMGGVSDKKHDYNSDGVGMRESS